MVIVIIAYSLVYPWHYMLGIPTSNALHGNLGVIKPLLSKQISSFMICFRQISSNKIVESSIWFHPNLLPQDRQLSMIWLCPSLGSPGSSKSLWSLPCDPHCSIIMRSIALGNLLPPNFVCNSVRDPRFTIFFSSRMFRHGLSSSSIYI